MSDKVYVSNTLEDWKSLTSTGKAIVDFYASWCGPCKFIAPIFASLSSEFPKITFVKVNADNASMSSIVQQFGITGLPTFITMNNGKVVERFVGATTNQLTDALQRLNNQSDV